MIERVQKQVIFEEAARKGVVGSQLLQIPDILKRLIGVNDIGVRVYGHPLAPIYFAKEGEFIDVERIAKFFSGLSRDVRVLDTSIGNLENDLLLFNLEIWSRMQLLKNKSMELSKKARVEKSRASLGAVWVFTESFNNLKNVDMAQSTAWMDASEGIAFIPNSGNEKTVPVQSVTAMETVIPQGNNFLDSSPKHAIDGLDSTNWRCLFLVDEWVSTVYSFTSSDLTAITIDPVGFGIELKVEAQVNNVYEEVIKSIIYSKQTYPIDLQKVTKLKVSFKPATSVLPKVVGIREIVLYQSVSLLSAEVYSTQLKPNDPFTEIKIDTKGQIPPGTKIQTYFRTSTGAAWNEVRSNDWHPIYPTDTTSIAVDYTTAVEGTSNLGFRGLYAKALNISSVPVTTLEGVMEVGENMFEVSSFKQDWVETGEFPKLLSPSDFTSRNTRKTWTHVPIRSYIGAGSGTCVQLSDETTISADTNLIKSGEFLAFQRKLDSEDFSSEVSTYNQLCIVPLCGTMTSNAMQFDYNYKFTCWVYAPKAFSYSGARYWFYQGYRNENRRLYRDIGKSYGTFTLYINDVLVVGEDTAKTISTDDKIEGSTDIDYGNSFSLSFNAGWNKVEICMNAFSPSKYGEDAFDKADSPFLQLSLYPSIFDIGFRESSQTYISKILASGSFKPVNEFDLLWNLPKEPNFWAWSNDRQYIYFNTNELKIIDGYFKGSPPDSSILYKSIQSDSIDNLFIKLVLQREDSTKLSPIISEYNVMVR